MVTLNPKVKTVTAFAPATCGNVAVGFDILGFATNVLGDTVTLSLRDDKKIVIEAIDSRDAIPFDIEKNTAGFVVKKICEDLQLDVGFSLSIKKGIPLSSGLGGSAASAVAAAVACSGFLTTPLSKQGIVQYALLGEAIASGQAHADNIAPCIYGGLTLVSSSDPVEVIALPIPDIFTVIVHPHLYVNTKDARKILSETVKLADYVRQTAQLAGFMAALYEKNTVLLRKSLTDFLIEPQREHFVPAFFAIKTAALNQGALGMSFSGSGPTMFAWAETKSIADKVAEAMRVRLKHEDVESDVWVAKISVSGARVVGES